VLPPGRSAHENADPSDVSTLFLVSKPPLVNWIDVGAAVLPAVLAMTALGGRFASAIVPDEVMGPPESPDPVAMLVTVPCEGA